MRRGFTLIETLVVFSILAIFSCLLVPSLTRLTNSYNLNMAGQAMSSTLRQAQCLAIAKHQNQQVYPQQTSLPKTIKIKQKL